MSTDPCRWLLLLICFTICLVYSNSKEIRVVCYYTNWSVYRPGAAKFSPQNINPYLCTHLVYAFGGFTKENTLKPFDKYQDIEKGGYAKFTGLKTYNKNLKTLLAIGGWNEGSSRFSPMVASPERRKELVKNTIKFLRQNHFDGLDLDWEYPSFRDGGKSRDRDNYAQLVQELREEFDRESEKTGRTRLLLTMAVPAGIEYINKGYDVPKLTKYLDWMNILSYDYHSAFEPAVNHHAPLYSLEEASEYNYDTELNIDYTIKHYLEKGADPNKLVLGIPTYGRSYTLFNPEANDIGAPADGPGDMGEATRENGYLAYYEICENVKNQDWEVVQPNPNAMGPYAFKGNQWVGYDDDQIARKKAQYVAENNLGGIMFWSIDNDDFRGTCHGKPYPIIEAAKEALISALGLNENTIQSTAKPIKSKTRNRVSSITRTTESSKKAESTNAPSTRRRNRLKSKTTESSSRTKSRKIVKPTTTEGKIYSSLELVTPSYTTPAPPSTPDQGGSFKCEDEGFFPHPKDCKKYYWCLSGPGELGIIAHQFTCPAGLYFNKAADSCDYTQNVYCKKSKTTTTTSTTTTTEKTVKTAATRGTLRTTTTTTTTEAPEEDYEYEDEDDIENEDPQVIKELLSLIKKAGGIEQLEKQLNLQDDDSNSEATTPSSISKSLVQRVLNSRKKTNLNSRGPQNAGIEKEKKIEKAERSKLTYTTISRQRPQKTQEEQEDENEEEDKEEGEEEEVEAEIEEKNKKTKSSKRLPEYVSIRRSRNNTSSVTESRNNILGENNEETDSEKEHSSSNKRQLPNYVNIRRQRPTTTEKTSTSKYVVIQRSTITEPAQNSSELSQKTSDLKYKTIKRGETSTESTVEEEIATEDDEESTNLPETSSSIPLSTTTTSEASTRKNFSLFNAITPKLSEPRPFTISTTPQSKLISETTRATKVSYPNIQKTVNQKETSTINTIARSRELSRFKLTTESSKEDETSLKPVNNRRRNRFTSTTASSYIDDDLIRTYRPSEIADLSSLTAADLGIYGDFNPSPGSRSRRIRPTTTSTTTTTTEKSEPALKTGRRTLPLARKILENAQFGTSKRIIPNRTEDQINSSSNLNTSKRVRGSIRLTTESTTTLPTSTISRGRKVIRRFRPTTEAPASNDLQKSNSYYPSRRRLSRTSSVPPLSTTEASKQTTKSDLEYLTTQFENEIEETTEDFSGEELENIKLSESNIRESSATNNGNNLSFDKDRDDKTNSKKLRSKIFEDSKFKEVSTTESTPIIRTRKIIRKLTSTTPTSVEDAVETTTLKQEKIIEKKEKTVEKNGNNIAEIEKNDSKGRRRKIIRRLRPINETSSETPDGFIRGRPFRVQTKPTTEEPEPASVKTVETLRGRRNRTDSTQRILANRSRSRFRFNATSTTKIDQVSTEATLSSIETTQSTTDHNIIEGTQSTIEVTSNTTETLNNITETITLPSEDDEKEVTTTELNLEEPLSSNKNTIESSTISTIISSTTQNTSNTTEATKTEDSVLDQNTTSSESPSTTENSRRRIPYKRIRFSTTESSNVTKVDPTSTTEITPVSSTSSTTLAQNVTENSADIQSEDIEYQTEINEEAEDTTLASEIETTTPKIIVTTTPTSTTRRLLKPPSSRPKFTRKPSTSRPRSNNRIRSTTTTTPKSEISTRSRLQYKFSTQIRPLNRFSTTESTRKEKEDYDDEIDNVDQDEDTNEEEEENIGAEKDEDENDETIHRFKPIRPSKSPLATFTRKTTEAPKPVIDLAEEDEDDDTEEEDDDAQKEKSEDENNNDFKLVRPSLTGSIQKTSEVLKPVIDLSEKEEKQRDEDDSPKEQGAAENEGTLPSFKPIRPSLTIFTRKTTPAPKPTDELSGIDEEAIKNRNKNLFSKKRKMNTPFVGVSSTTPSSLLNETTTSESTSTNATLSTVSSSEALTTKSFKPVTKPPPIETTELLTTLHHVFAETEPTPTEKSDDNLNNIDSKVERLVEVNRIVEVHADKEIENITQIEDNKHLDKIGAVNRVTVIKVIDPNENEIREETPTNETKPPVVDDRSGEVAIVQEIPNPQRNDRKFEIFDDKKINSKDAADKPLIIDGISHINIITPRPYYSTEASTIALEGLFQSDSPQNTKIFEKETPTSKGEDELLETEHSRYINVRVLNDDIPMRARVVEIIPEKRHESIKIVPIKVEMTKKLIPNSDFQTSINSGVPKVNIKLLQNT